MYALPCSSFPRSPLTIYTDKKRKQTDDDDDDFIVPDDADDSDVASIPSDGDRRSTSRSSARSVSALDSDEDDEDLVPNRKKAASKPSGKSQASNAAPVLSSSPFLTAAERSTQDKKLGKKSIEKPFNFLKDIRDKDGVRPGEPGYDPRTIYVPKSSWAEFTPFEKQVCGTNSITEQPTDQVVQFWGIKQNHYDTVSDTRALQLHLTATVKLDLVLPERVRISQYHMMYHSIEGLYPASLENS